MSGVSALLDLYKSFRKESQKEEERERKEHLQRLLAEQEGDVENGVEGWESEWHETLYNQNWDEVQLLLEEYDFDLYRPKQPKKKPRRLKIVKFVLWVKDSCFPPKEEEEEEEEVAISPLLGLNGHRETPLHIAIRVVAPDRLLLRLLFTERKAARVVDENGRLPLHLAAIHERSIQVIDRLIRAFFLGLQWEDKEGRTALWHAVQRAKETSILENRSTQPQKTQNALADPIEFNYYWGLPRDQTEIEWQERQEKYWSKVRFILLSYSTRKKILIDSERDILVEILEHGAPPEVIEVTLFASQRILKTDPTLASRALQKFMKRQYPIKNLQLLLHHFPVHNLETMEAARKILADHYHMGCKLRPGRDMAYRAEMEARALNKRYIPTLACTEWWDKIKCLLRLCGHGNDKEGKQKFENSHLLHAALSNCDTPPSLVQLLMVVSPKAIHMPHPFNGSLLVHLVCRTWKYNLFPQSQNLGVQLDMEEPPMEQILKIVLAADPTLLRRRYKDRLPLHDAVATSKSLQFMDVLLQHDPKALAIRDPVTKLFPFQLASTVSSLHKNSALWAAARYSPLEWKRLNPEERAAAVESVIKEQELDQVTMCYYLLRHFPAAVSTATILRKPAIFRDHHGKGMISAHYLVFCYSSKTPGAPSELNSKRLELIKDAIRSKRIPKALEEWWSKLKFWIWYCHLNSLGELDREDQFLLHAACANEDTPPIIVELLLALFPDSAKTPGLGTENYPLHIACATPCYKPESYEIEDGRNVLKLLVEAYPEAAMIVSVKGLPIDIANRHGKTGNLVEPLLNHSIMVEAEPELSATQMYDSFSSQQQGASGSVNAADNYLYENNLKSFENKLENEMRNFEEGFIDDGGAAVYGASDVFEDNEEDFEDEVLSS